MIPNYLLDNLDLIGKKASKSAAMLWLWVHAERTGAGRGTIVASERSLAKTWRVSRTTVRTWLEQWQAEGSVVVSATSDNTVLTLPGYGKTPTSKSNDYKQWLETWLSEPNKANRYRLAVQCKLTLETVEQTARELTERWRLGQVKHTNYGDYSEHLFNTLNRKYANQQRQTRNAKDNRRPCDDIEGDDYLRRLQEGA